jgi:RNA polymerase sigma factor (sigma-70 family)
LGELPTKGTSGMQTRTNPARRARRAPPIPGIRGRRRLAFSEGGGRLAADDDLQGVDIEQEMAQARPRLLRLARANGLPLDAAHEVVQETLLEAWRHLDVLSDLSDPAGFQAWLNAICRNVCRRYSRAFYARAQHELLLATRGDPSGYDDEEGADDLHPLEVADPLAIDPVEELERHDRETLLDRALGYLAAPTREAVTLCYLAELPQREAAQQLGVTIAALEARLHRARRQLRQVLGGELRAQAEAVGLTLDTDADSETTAALWRDTRLWCPSCARHRLRGAFEPLPGGRINLHLRCPGCAHEVNSWGHVPLDGMQSFRPAYKRVMQHTHAYFLPGLLSGRLACEKCGSLQHLDLVRTDELLSVSGGSHDQHDQHDQSGLLLVTRCPACGWHHAEIAVAALLWTQPVVQRFLDTHPRSMTEPETLVEYRGQIAIRVRMTDISSAAQLTLMAHPQTLRVLAILQR